MSLEKVIRLKEKGEIKEALDSCLELLSSSPSDPQARVLLANLYYLKGCVDLCVEEIRKLRIQHPERVSLKRLHVALEPDLIEDESEKESISEERSPARSTEVEQTEVEQREAGQGGAVEQGANTEQAPLREAQRGLGSTPQKGKIKSSDIKSTIDADDQVLAESDFDFDDLDLLIDD